MTEKIDRYIIEELSRFSSYLWITDRKDNSRICTFDTGNKKLNRELAEYCLKRIAEK